MNTIPPYIISLAFSYPFIIMKTYGNIWQALSENLNSPICKNQLIENSIAIPIINDISTIIRFIIERTCVRSVHAQNNYTVNQKGHDLTCQSRWIVT